MFERVQNVADSMKRNGGQKLSVITLESVISINFAYSVSHSHGFPFTYECPSKYPRRVARGL